MHFVGHSLFLFGSILRQPVINILARTGFILLASGSWGDHRFVLKTIAHKHFTSRRCKPKPCASKPI